MKKWKWLPVFIAVMLALAIVHSVHAAEFDQSHALFSQVLKTYVHNERVDYAALKAHPQELNRYLSEVAAVRRKHFDHWTRKQQIAFLINAYNAYTLKLIIDHYPIKSIKDIGHFWRGPWAQPVVHLFGKSITLDTIEQDMLRKDYREPRIHFALVCASIGCPPLRSEAYLATRLDEQLNDQGKRFLANRSKNRVDATDHTVYLSPIFKWYGEDFKKKSGSVLAFLKPYWPKRERIELKSGHFEIRYTDYNWSLNGTNR